MAALILVWAYAAAGQRPRSTNQDNDGSAKTTTPTPPPAPPTVKAKYEGGVFGYKKKIDGTLNFDDTNQRFWCFGMTSRKEILFIPYNAITGAYGDTHAVQPAAASVISHVPYVGLPASPHQNKCVTSRFNTTIPTAKSRRHSFRLENKDILDSVLNTVAAKSRLPLAVKYSLRRNHKRLRVLKHAPWLVAVLHSGPRMGLDCFRKQVPCPQSPMSNERSGRVEGFDVRILHLRGADVRGDRMGLPQYGFRHAAADDFTVRTLEGNQIRPSFPGFEVDVLDGRGRSVQGNTKLSTVRASY